jgi:hypothetical protein
VIIIQRATREDIRYIAQNLRETDRREAAGLFGPEIGKAVWDSALRAKECYAALDGETPVALFGVGQCPMRVTNGVPWMVGTEHLREHRKALLRDASAILNGWFERFTTLSNFVSKENAVSIRWLKKLGFSFADFRGVPTGYLLFYRRRPDVS